jgi:hypothetical protein
MRLDKEAMNDRTQSEPEHIGSIVLRVMNELAKGSGDHNAFQSDLVVGGPLAGPVPSLARGSMNEENQPPFFKV